MAWAFAPLFHHAPSGAPSHGGVDRSGVHQHTRRRQRLEDPQPAPGPAVEAVTDRRVRTVFS